MVSGVCPSHGGKMFLVWDFLEMVGGEPGVKKIRLFKGGDYKKSF
jgi:hypothetical protein